MNDFIDEDRAIIQYKIIPVPDNSAAGYVIVAMCSDDTFWEGFWKDTSGKYSFVWKKLPPIPQGDLIKSEETPDD